MATMKVRQIWVDEKGEELPDTDKKLYDAPCRNCGPMPCVGRVGGVFLCLGCIDEQEAEEADMPTATSEDSRDSEEGEGDGA